MHTISGKNRYLGIMLMRMSQEYYSLGREGMFKASADHVRDLSKYRDNLTHTVTAGLNGKYDQVTIIEADTLEEIHEAAIDFRMGEKGKYIEVVDIIVGIKAPKRDGGQYPAGAKTKA